MQPRTVIIVTGSSGSGKSTALATFEDAGFFCVDNMPVDLMPPFLQQAAEQAADNDVAGWAFGMDLRDRHFLDGHSRMLADLKNKGYQAKIVFLDADDQVLLRRYNQTRRHHPLGRDGSLLDAVRTEKRQLQPLRKTANHVIDTTHLSVHELKFAIFNIARQYTAITGMAINVISFGFKYGTPSEADLLIDVRFLKNPYFVPELKPLDGESDQIREFVLQDPQTALFLESYLKLLDQLIPLYEKEGKAYLTLAIGCTGGRHRSVVIAQQVYDHIRLTQPTVRMMHRDIRFG